MPTQRLEREHAVVVVGLALTFPFQQCFIIIILGQLQIRGLADPTCESWVKLQEVQADPNDATLLNRLVVGTHAANCWNTGDTIVVSSPDWDINNSFEALVIAIDTVAGALVVDTPIPPAFVHATVQTAPDYAVEVASLNRNIVFTADEDDIGPYEGALGGHLIIYGTPHIDQLLEGVEIRNFGQQGNLGRYPIHFHICQDVAGAVVSKNVVHHSNQRCVVVHGTFNANVTDNVAYETKGHCYFTEDGIEEGNTFARNLGMNIRRPANVIPNENDDRPAVFWITNAGNHW